jgi:hypothetical protein
MGAMETGCRRDIEYSGMREKGLAPRLFLEGTGRRA